MKRKIEQVIEKVFCDNANQVFFNGLRAEGCSIIVAESVWSHQIEKLKDVLNAEMSDELQRPLGEWRVRKAISNTMVNKEVPEEVRNDCYEVRLIYKGWYRR